MLLAILTAACRDDEGPPYQCEGGADATWDADGAPDASRKTVYSGEAQIMTNMGALPVSFDIDADNLADAVAKYGDAARAGIERTMKELQDLRRQASSGLIVPPAGAASAITGGAMGGMPGGGKIQLP